MVYRKGRGGKPTLVLSAEFDFISSPEEANGSPWWAEHQDDPSPQQSRPDMPGQRKIKDTLGCGGLQAMGLSGVLPELKEPSSLVD